MVSWIICGVQTRAYFQEGDVIHLKVLGQHIVIVNSAKAARDLFEKRVHSDRPPMAMVDL